MNIRDEEENYPLILTVHDICKILKISKPTAYEMMNKPDFPLLQIGRCKRVYRDAFFRWVKTRVNS